MIAKEINWEKLARERGEDEVRARVKIESLREALKRCLIMDPLDPFKRGNMIKAALTQTEPDSGSALPCWVVVQTWFPFGPNGNTETLACLSVHMDEDAAKKEFIERTQRGERVIWHESIIRINNIIHDPCAR